MGKRRVDFIRNSRPQQAALFSARSTAAFCLRDKDKRYDVLVREREGKWMGWFRARDEIWSPDWVEPKNWPLLESKRQWRVQWKQRTIESSWTSSNGFLKLMRMRGWGWRGEKGKGKEKALKRESSPCLCLSKISSSETLVPFSPFFSWDRDESRKNPNKASACLSRTGCEGQQEAWEVELRRSRPESWRSAEARGGLL